MITNSKEPDPRMNSTVVTKRKKRISSCYDTFNKNNTITITILSLVVMILIYYNDIQKNKVLCTKEHRIACICILYLFEVHSFDDSRHIFSKAFVFVG